MPLRDSGRRRLVIGRRVADRGMNGTGQRARPGAWRPVSLRRLRSRRRVCGGDVQGRGRHRVPEAISTRLLTDVDVRGLLTAPVAVAAARLHRRCSSRTAGSPPWPWRWCQLAALA